MSQVSKVDFTEYVFAFDVVISHKKCFDGTLGSYCIWRTLPKSYQNLLAKEGGFYSNNKRKSFSSDDSDDSSNKGFIHPNSCGGALLLQEKGFPLVFVFVQHTDEIPKELVFNKKVLILDVDLGDNLIKTIGFSEKVLLIDHHDSTNHTLERNKYAINNIYKDKFTKYVNTSTKECACTLTWKLTHKEPLPPLLDIVRVSDNFAWEDNHNAKFIMHSLILKRTFKSFQDIDNTYKTWDKQYNSYVNNGKSMVAYENVIVKKIAKQCDHGYIQTNDGQVYSVAYVQCNVLHSEVGSIMKYYAERRFNIKIDFCVTWKYASHKNIVSVSLRNSNSNLDLSEIARNVKGSNGGGGGHCSASSFFFTGLENFHNYILKTHPAYSTVYYK